MMYNVCEMILGLINNNFGAILAIAIMLKPMMNAIGITFSDIYNRLTNSGIQ